MQDYGLFSNTVIRDQDHPPVIIYSASNTADRVGFILGKTNLDPRKELSLAAIRLRAAGATKLCLACNTAHHFISDLQNVVPDTPFLDMLELTFQYIIRLEVHNIGILATTAAFEARIFENKVASLKCSERPTLLTPLNTPTGDQRNMMKAMWSIKAGNINPVVSDEAFDSLCSLTNEICNLAQNGAGAIILGCTELPIIVTPKNLQCLVNANIPAQYKSINLSLIQKILSEEIVLVNPAKVLVDEILRLSLLSRKST